MNLYKMQTYITNQRGEQVGYIEKGIYHTQRDKSKGELFNRKQNFAGKHFDIPVAIDKAILEDASLEHPKTEGKTDDKYKVNEITNRKSENDTGQGYIFSGQAEPNSVVTLYIYSDLPVVITIKTNEYGNWEYEFSKSLVE